MDMSKNGFPMNGSVKIVKNFNLHHNALISKNKVSNLLA